MLPSEMRTTHLPPPGPSAGGSWSAGLSALLTRLAGLHTPSTGDAFPPTWWLGSLSGPRQLPGLLSLLETEPEEGEGWERGGQEAGSSQPFNPSTHSSAQVPQQRGSVASRFRHHLHTEGPWRGRELPAHLPAMPPPAPGEVRSVPRALSLYLESWSGQGTREILGYW